MIKPITPSEVAKAKAVILPEAVLEVFNQLITERWDGRQSWIRMQDALKLVSHRLGVNQDTVIKNKYLDIEDIYRKAGWVVKYDQPAYNETYDANWTFTKKVD